MHERRNIKCNFYQVILPKDKSKSIANALRELTDLPPDDEKRVAVIYRRPSVKLDYAEYGLPVWLMDMLRIRMDVDAKFASKTGRVRSAKLDDDEGVGEDSALLYDPSVQIAILQSGRDAMSRADIEGYFTAKANTSVQLKALLTGEGYQRMSRMKYVGKFEVSVAGLTRGTIWKSQDVAVKAIADLEERFGAPSLTFSVSMARKKGRLENAIESATQLIGLRSEGVDVRKLMVSGVDDDDEPVLPFNLLPYGMSENVEVKFTGRAPSRQVRFDALRHAWIARRDEVRQMQKSTEEP